jgi:hypothetical protein
MKKHAFLLGSLLFLAPQGHAVEITVGTETAEPQTIATIPVTVANTNEEVTLLTFVVTVPLELGTPTIVVGADQPNLSTTPGPGDVPASLYLDEITPGTFQVLALALSAPNIAAEGGNAISLEFDLDGVVDGVYPITIVNAEVYDISSMEVAATLLSGQLTVETTSLVVDWEWLVD